MSKDLYLELTKAYYDARVHKRNTINQLKFELNLERNLHQLYSEIIDHRYNLSPSIAFIVTQPKRREIFAATFRDRVVHHLVFNYINPYWDKRFIYDSYSCRQGKGTHFAINRIKRFMRAASDNYTQPAWILKLDILGYFMHIQQQKVWDKCQQQFQETVDDDYAQTIQYLLHKIIFHNCVKNVRIKSKISEWDDLPKDKSLFYIPTGQGFPIGNLTSQLFSNIYLHELDCFIKYQLGFKYYGRYVDDFIIIDQDKNRLVKAQQQIDHFLKEKLSLKLHPRKIYLQPLPYGVEFLGAIIRPYHILPGSRLVHNFQVFRCEYKKAHWQQRERIALEKAWQSYLGQLGQFRSYRLLQLAQKETIGVKNYQLH